MNENDWDRMIWIWKNSVLMFYEIEAT